MSCSNDLRYSWFTFSVEAEDIKKLASTLNTIANEKTKQQKVRYSSVCSTLYIGEQVVYYRLVTELQNIRTWEWDIYSSM